MPIEIQGSIMLIMICIIMYIIGLGVRGYLEISKEEEVKNIKGSLCKQLGMKRKHKQWIY